MTASPAGDPRTSAPAVTEEVVHRVRRNALKAAAQLVEKAENGREAANLIHILAEAPAPHIGSYGLAARAPQPGPGADWVLWLFREFVLLNATQWKMGSNHRHPMWALVSETLGRRNEVRDGELWRFIQAGNDTPLSETAAPAAPPHDEPAIRAEEREAGTTSVLRDLLNASEKLRQRQSELSSAKPYFDDYDRRVMNFAAAEEHYIGCRDRARNSLRSAAAPVPVSDGGEWGDGDPRAPWDRVNKATGKPIPAPSSPAEAPEADELGELSAKATPVPVKIRLSEANDEPDRVMCHKCGCDHFKVNVDGLKEGNRVINSVECERCHDIFCLELETELTPVPSSVRVNKDAQRDWQPISTAPRDGTRIVLGIIRNDCVFGQWEDQWVESSDCWREAVKRPTHWAMLSPTIVPSEGVREAERLREDEEENWSPPTIDPASRQFHAGDVVRYKLRKHGSSEMTVTGPALEWEFDERPGVIFANGGWDHEDKLTLVRAALRATGREPEATAPQSSGSPAEGGVS